MSLSLQTNIINTQEDISIEFKTDGITDKNNTGEAEAIIKEGVQAVLKNLKKY